MLRLHGHDRKHAINTLKPLHKKVTDREGKDRGEEEMKREEKVRGKEKKRQRKRRRK